MLTLEREGDEVDVGAQCYHSDYRYAYELVDAVGPTSAKRVITGKTQFLLEDGSSFLYDHRMPYMKACDYEHGSLTDAYRNDEQWNI